MTPLAHTNFLITSWGINVVLSSSISEGFGFLSRTLRLSSSHKCSIGFMSALSAGQSMVSIRIYPRKCLVAYIYAMYDTGNYRALTGSYLINPTYGTTCSRRISVMYRSATSATHHTGAAAVRNCLNDRTMQIAHLCAYSPDLFYQCHANTLCICQ